MPTLRDRALVTICSRLIFLTFHGVFISRSTAVIPQWARGWLVPPGSEGHKKPTPRQPSVGFNKGGGFRF